MISLLNCSLSPVLICILDQALPLSCSVLKNNSTVFQILSYKKSINLFFSKNRQYIYFCLSILLWEQSNLQTGELEPNKQLQLTLCSCLICLLLLHFYLHLIISFPLRSPYPEKKSAYYKYGISSDCSYQNALWLYV